ncbi:MAG TPA: hypothetical protein VH916_03245 [Dehalococcoidia bacterium]|jgi:hypothetical protein
MATGQWFTLVRFRGDPTHLTGVAQTRNARETLTLLDAWDARYPEETTVVFDPQNKPLERSLIEWLASGPSRQDSGTA